MLCLTVLKYLVFSVLKAVSSYIVQFEKRTDLYERKHNVFFTHVDLMTSWPIQVYEDVAVRKGQFK